MLIPSEGTLMQSKPTAETLLTRSLLTHLYFEAIGHLLQEDRASQQWSLMGPTATVLIES